ncbi:hypothetical protein FBU30_007153 [Linnemannia zychae]|nr:hypothetical protein FBU30_007153 [Linnemannia zychae]
MHSTIHPRNESLIRNEKESDEEQEILPDTAVEILRRMAEEIKCPIWVDHLEQVIEAFNQLKEAFESEDGHTLSQVPRQYNADPQENLTQLYPYPEKTDEVYTSDQLRSDTNPIVASTVDATSSSSRAPTMEPMPVHHNIATRSIESLSTQSTVPEYSQSFEDLSMMNDIDCFDVDLDSVSADQAALLAEKMLAIVSLSPSIDNIPSGSYAASSSRGAKYSTSQNHAAIDMARVKEECVDEDEILIQPRQDKQDNIMIKTEFLSDSEDSAFALSGPTQERASKENNFLLCGTYLTPQKKTRMDNVAKALKGRIINDLVNRPTHVVMDIRIMASQEAGYWVDETPYQISDNEMGCNPAKLSRASRLQGDPPLFTNYEFQLAGTFITPSREEIELIIKIGGGTIVPKLFHRDRFSANNNSNSSYIKHILLYDQANDGVMSLKKLKSEVEATRRQSSSVGKAFTVVTCRNLLDCISQYDMERIVETIPI